MTAPTFAELETTVGGLLMTRVAAFLAVWCLVAVGFCAVWAWALTDRRRLERAAEVLAADRRHRLALLAARRWVDPGNGSWS